jgi:hypothetical protein
LYALAISYSKGSYFEDVIFIIQVAYYSKNVSILKIPLYNYRHRDGPITASASKKKIAYMFMSLCLVKDFLEVEGIYNQYKKEYMIRLLMHAVCYNFLDYIKLPKKESDVELDNYMKRLRKSKLLRQENLLLLKDAISDMEEDESRSKDYYITVYNVFISLVYSCWIFQLLSKTSIVINNNMQRISALVQKINFLSASSGGNAMKTTI